MAKSGQFTAKGEATRQRILDAALGEFAEHGVAGSRVDRIAEAAGTSKPQIYAYFGSKDELFDVVFFNSLGRIMQDAPINPEDLADWAVRLYDDYLERPDLIRLSSWHRLERKSMGPLVNPDRRVDEEKLAGIKSAQEQGKVRQGDASNIMALVISMSMAWSPVSGVWAAWSEEDESVHQARKALLREAVSAAIRPS